MYPIGYLLLIVSLFSFLSSIIDNVATLIIGVIIGVVSLVIGEFLWAFLKKPKLVFEVSNIKQGKLGFSVYVRKKAVEEATVRCNDIKYDWEQEDGTKSEKVDLRIGDPPVTFYPFDVSMHFIELEDLLHYNNSLIVDSPEYSDVSGGVLLLVREPATEKVVYHIVYVLSKKSRSTIFFLHLGT